MDNQLSNQPPQESTTDHTRKFVIILAIVLIASGLGFWLWSQFISKDTEPQVEQDADQRQAQQFPVEDTIVKNPADAIPDTNPFAPENNNPLSGAYQNPFD